LFVWGFTSTLGTGELVFIDNIMEKNIYLNILKNNLRRSEMKMEILDTFKYYQENDPKNIRHILYRNICYITVQNITSETDCKPMGRTRKIAITSREALKQRLREE
jgi:hypothetical protein